MADRLKGKTAIIVGAGQTPGETIGNGRAMSILFAREGAQVLCVDRVAERAEETAAMIVAEGGQATAFTANVTKAEDVAAMIEAGKQRLGRIDILVNNVGIGGGDGPAHRVEEAAFDRLLSVNRTGMAKRRSATCCQVPLRTAAFTAACAAARTTPSSLKRRITSLKAPS